MTSKDLTPFFFHLLTQEDRFRVAAVPGSEIVETAKLREREGNPPPPPLFPISRARIFARLSLTRYPYCLRAWKRLDSELIGVSFTPACEEVGSEG